MTLHELEQNLAQALKGKGLGGPRHISRRLVDRGQSEGFTLEVLWKVLDLPLQPEDFYEYVVSKAFPESRRLEAAQYAPYFPVVLSLYRLFCEYQRTVPGDSFVQRHPLRFLEEEEIAALPDEEYRRFLQAFHDDYIYEIMQLSSEIHGYNTLDHVLGVHDLALSLARQYKKLGYPVDLGRVSGAAAGHDIGKFGVMKKDAKKSSLPSLLLFRRLVSTPRHPLHPKHCGESFHVGSGAGKPLFGIPYPDFFGLSRQELRRRHAAKDAHLSPGAILPSHPQ